MTISLTVRKRVIEIWCLCDYTASPAGGELGERGGGVLMILSAAFQRCCMYIGPADGSLVFVIFWAVFTTL